MRRFIVNTLSGLLCAVVALFIVVFASGFFYQLSPWQFDQSHALAAVLVGLAASVAIVLCWSWFFRGKNWFWRLVRIIFVGVSVCLPVVLLLLLLTDNGLLGLAPMQLQKPVIVTLIVAFFAVLLLNNLPLPKTLLLVVNLVCLGIVAYPVVGKDSRDKLAEIASGKQRLFDDSERYVYSSVHDVKITDYTVFAKKLGSAGGGLGLVDKDLVLLVSGEGNVYLVETGGAKLRLQPASLPTPFDLQSYLDNAENPSQWFRVTDALLENTSSMSKKLLVSYHHWNIEKACIVLRMAESTIDFSHFAEAKPEWRVVFDTEPCMQLPLYNGTGGRMDFLDDEHVLLTVGESFGDWQDKALRASGYGKIHKINLETGAASVFTTGHRNPQGLLVEQEQIWSTEHGPDGGDELNLLVEGVDYGWPEATYGTAYGQKSWPKNTTPGDHTTGQRPVYAWVPSIGISNLIRVRGTLFNNWQGDLLVASLYGRSNGKSLFRLKLYEGRVVVSERLKTGAPIRDLIELDDGRILLWDGMQNLSVVEPASLVFSTCAGCHALRWRTHGVGPDLMGIVGDKVARHTDFAYSSALKGMGGVWSRQRLDQFLENPKAMVPGTSMNFEGIADEQQRRAIIDYLEKLKLSPG